MKPVTFLALRLFRISLMAFISIAFSYASVWAYQLTLEWDSNVDEDLAGYVVYYGTTSRDYEHGVDIGDETSCTISNLQPGVTYYFAVTAYDIDGNESNYSAEITYPSSEVTDASGGGGGGAGGCFISTGEDAKYATFELLGFIGIVLITFTGFLLDNQKR